MYVVELDKVASEHPVNNLEKVSCSVNNSARKLCLYSVHDSSLLPMLVAMGCFDGQWPPYAADIRIELYVDNQQDHWVKILYCDKVSTAPMALLSFPSNFQNNLKLHTG